jgi:ABC-type transport system substrate-binding protein
LVYQIGTAEIEQTVEAVRAMLKDVGVEVSSRKYAPNLFRAPANMGGILYSGKFEMAIYPRTLQAVSDVNGLYGCATIPPHGENATRYCNPTVDRLLVDVESSYDEALRRKLFAKVQQKIVADVPTIILYVWRGGYAYNRHVRNLQPPILTPFDDMMNVDVE